MSDDVTDRLAEMVPHTPTCGIQKLPGGRVRVECHCDEQTHRRRIATFRQLTAEESTR